MTEHVTQKQEKNDRFKKVLTEILKENNELLKMLS